MAARRLGPAAGAVGTPPPRRRRSGASLRHQQHCSVVSVSKHHGAQFARVSDGTISARARARYIWRDSPPAGSLVAYIGTWCPATATRAPCTPSGRPRSPHSGGRHPAVCAPSPHSGETGASQGSPASSIMPKQPPRRFTHYGSRWDVTARQTQGQGIKCSMSYPLTLLTQSGDSPRGSDRYQLSKHLDGGGPLRRGQRVAA